MAQRKQGLGLRYQWLGQRLKELREERGFKLEEVCAYLECSTGTLSRVETAQYPVKKPTLLALLEFYDVSDRRTREHIFELREECWRKGWWDGYSDAYYDKDFMDLAWIESRAAHIRWYEPTIIPGLLQTRDYAEVAVRAFERLDVTDEQVHRWVDLRIARQSILTDMQAPQLDVIMDEAVIRRPMGGAAVMREQLEHLAGLADRPNLSIRLVPFSAYDQPSFVGTFTIFELAGAYPDVAYAESLGGGVVVEDAASLDRFERVYAALDKAALSPSDSQAYLADAIKEIQYV